MIRNRFTQIGIDRLVRLKWLDKVSSLVLAGNKANDIKNTLQNDLKDTFRSDNINVRGSIDKTITILMKVWLRAPSELEFFQMAGLKMLKQVPKDHQIAIHWGMIMAVYPFWSGVAVQVGRLLRLQGSAASFSVQRRIREQYGERETVSRRTRYVLRSYVDWEILQETASKGIYTAGKILSIEDPQLIAWLIEAALHARANGSATLKEMLESPSFFPFRIKSIQAESLKTASSSLEILRHGLDDILVILRKESN